MNDTASTTGFSVYKDKQTRDEYVSSKSVLVGKAIDTIVVDLMKTGLPTGTFQVGIINNDLSIKQLFGTMDAKNLTTFFKTYSFSLPLTQNYTIQAGDRIGIKFTGGDSSNNVVILADFTNSFDGTNSFLSYYDILWHSVIQDDLYMKLLVHLY
jgi:hypothetical protein